MTNRRGSGNANQTVGDRVVGAVEEAELLDEWGSSVRRLIEPLVGSGKRRDVLTGKWLGHPVHPAGVLVPLSCWTAATTLDLVGGGSARRASKRLVGLGVLAAAPAALTGSADLLDLSGAEQRVGTLHAAMNGAAMALFGASWLQRRRGHHLRGMALGAIALSATAGAAYLGGHLTYRRGVGVDTTAFQSGPDEWTDIEITAGARDGVAHATVGALDLVVIEHDADAEPAVLESRCTHRGGPLHEGELAGGCIVCPWHGSRFDASTGAVQGGPASAPQPVYETRRQDGKVSVRRTERGDLRRNPVGARAEP